MEYSIMPGDRVLIDKTAYGLRVPFTRIKLLDGTQPQRGEIAVFDSPVDGTRLIKRIAAVGGDYVTLMDGRLSINGTRIDNDNIEYFDEHSALLNLDTGGGPNIAQLQIPEGFVLVLGDHRGDSLDSRYFGLVPIDAFYGRANRIYYRRGEGFSWQAL
jgi:signal peptidase I